MTGYAQPMSTTNEPFVYSTACARCGRDGAPPHNASEDIEVCPDCEEALRAAWDVP